MLNDQFLCKVIPSYTVCKTIVKWSHNSNMVANSNKLILSKISIILRLYLRESQSIGSILVLQMLILRCMS